MLKVPDIFGEHMLLQREMEISVWGMAEPEATVTVKLQGQKANTKADGKGNWKLRLGALQTSFGECLVITSGEEEIIREDVSVGDVWIAGGQSNMEFPMLFEKHYKEVVNDCYDPELRYFDVPKICFEGQETEFDYKDTGIWRKTDSSQLKYFSAVGYYFGRELRKARGVPVGIIGCSYSGTASCAWLDASSLPAEGRFWHDNVEKYFYSTDRNKYYKDQAGRLIHNRSSVIEDPFSRFSLPVTHTPDEFREFFELHSIDEILGKEDELHPAQIPGSLFEHMVKPIAPYGIKGVLWYQGESDDYPGRQSVYEEMLKSVIQDWRRLWNDQNLPFLIVQLPPWESWIGMEEKTIRCDNFVELRVCQEKVCRSLENAFLCSIADTGEKCDIHPKDKKTVGERLALLARGHVYYEDIVCDPPEVEKYFIENGVIRILFRNAPGGLVVSKTVYSGLSVLSDGKRLMYSIKAEGMEMQITPYGYGRTVTVDYGKSNYFECGIWNCEGIPCIPFRITMHVNIGADETIPCRMNGGEL